MKFRGDATIEGKRYWCAAWVKEKDGKKFFSMAFRPVEDAKAKPAASRANFDKPIEDGLPFWGAGGARAGATP